MRVIRLYVDAALAPGARATLSGPAAAHATRVLRLSAGDAVTAFNGDGSDYPARIAALRRGEVELAIDGRAAACPESPLAIRLVQAVARGEKMDWVIQKATELGVAAIQPVLSARSVVRLDADAAARRQSHWQGVAIAACEQCGRARLPEIAAPLPLAGWLQRAPAQGLRRLQLAPGATTQLAALASSDAPCELLVGPEGGLDEAEVDAAGRAGYQPHALGPRILRSETAAIAAITVLQAAAGDLR